MTELDIRWHQRLNSYQKALAQLGNAVELRTQRELSNLEQQGLIQAFEFTHELAWNLIKDYFAYQGNTEITGSRDAAREAFTNNLISDGEGWMEMVRSRNLTSHSYNQSTAQEIITKVCNSYYALFCEFCTRMQSIKDKC